MAATDSSSSSSSSSSSQKKQSTKLQKLRCSIKNYEWGRIGTQSQVARLHSLNSGDEIEPEKPYAEFWMATHESGPSFLLPDTENGGGSEEPLTLKAWVSQNPHVLGDKVLNKWGGDLPFLFKVLSVAKALSIQAHPDKKLAEELHKSLPHLYKDDNHKPEMTLALTEFEALCGFISLEELKGVLQNVREVLELVSSANADHVLLFTKEDGKEKGEEFFKLLFTQLMSANKDVISEVVSKLTSRLNLESKVRQLTVKEQLALRLEKQYPADVGIISAFFLNYVKLSSGEALYLGANEPHAYLSGDSIECMATSDNVVRAGLTPKHRDVSTLCSMLTYNLGHPELLQGIPLNTYTTKYLPTFDEFEVDCCILPAGATTDFPAIPGPSIFLVTDGRGTMGTVSSEVTVSGGDVLFAPADITINLASASDLRLYRAGVNSKFFEPCG